MQGIALTLLQNIRIAPTQTRMVPIKFSQSVPFHQHEIRIRLTWASPTASNTLTVVLPINHRTRWDASPFAALKASYFHSRSNPTPFTCLPPLKDNIGTPRPPIIALRAFPPSKHPVLTHMFAQMVQVSTLCNMISSTTRYRDKNIVGSSSPPAELPG